MNILITGGAGYVKLSNRILLSQHIDSDAEINYFNTKFIEDK